MSSQIDAFERGDIDNASFHHRDHIRMAWSFLRELGFPEGALRFDAALRRFVAKAGKPQLYHATITWAYLVTIHDRIARRGEETWDDFAADNEELFTWKPSLLDSWYRAETLGSEHARRVFVLPDAHCVAPPLKY